MSVLRQVDSSTGTEDVAFLYQYVFTSFTLLRTKFWGLEKFSFHVLYRGACITTEVRGWVDVLKNLFVHTEYLTYVI